jgi:hypothetical protein
VGRVKPLTAHQRSALHLAARKGGANLADGKIRRQTANLLMLREWVTIVNGVVLITKAGRTELHKPLPPSPPVFLRQRDGLTSRMDQRVHEEPELMRDQLRPDWAEHSTALHEASCADADAMRLSGLPHPEEQIAELRRMAAERGVDVKAELRYVEHAKKVLERKVRREAA